MSSYYDDNPIQLLRQKRREAEERKRASFERMYGPTHYAKQMAYESGQRIFSKEYAYRTPDQLQQLASKASRLLVMQHHSCYLCGGVFTSPVDRDFGPTRDHVIPQALGGRDRDNILLAHRVCNFIKSNRPPTSEELAYLRTINVALKNNEGPPPPRFSNPSPFDSLKTST